MLVPELRGVSEKESKAKMLFKSMYICELSVVINLQLLVITFSKIGIDSIVFLGPCDLSASRCLEFQSLV